MNIITDRPAPAALAPQIPPQRVSSEGAPAPAAVYPNLFDLGKGVAASDVWARTACPGATTNEPHRCDVWNDVQFAAYAAGYEAGVPEAEADIAAQGGYAGIMAAFRAEMASWSDDAEPASSCPAWCTEDEHDADGYHVAELGEVTLSTTWTDENGSPVPATLSLCDGELPGAEPVFMVTGPGCDGFQGSAQEFGALAQLLTSAVAAL